MKIGILSDTHIRKGRTLPEFVWETLSEVDVILHAGDIITGSLLKELELLAPVIAVRGNGDWMIENLPDKTVFQLGHLKIGMTHGCEGPGQNTPQRALNTFAHDLVDVIIFGHSHMPYKNYTSGILLFNPGSPTEKRKADFYSMGLMTIEDNAYDIQHLFF
jgi:putative phosphoesterase